MSVKVETDAAVTTIILDRPAVRNAADGPTATALAQAFRDFEKDPQARVAVLYGRGSFCAGADLQAVGSGQNQNQLQAEGDGPMGPTRMQLAKPVIAAIEGHAVAGGLELALWCDLRIAATDAIFGVYCRRWGVPLVDGGTVRLPRLVGHSHAMDLILTGRPVGGEEALRMGLANRLCESGTALATALEVAGELATFPQRCLRSDRLSAIEQWGLDLGPALANEVRRGMATIRSGETQEGATRFADGEGRHGSFAAFSPDT